MKYLLPAFSFLLFWVTPAFAQNSPSISGLQQSDKTFAGEFFETAMKHFFKAQFDSAIVYLDKGIPYAIKTNDNNLVLDFFLGKANANILNEAPVKGVKALKDAAAFLTTQTNETRRQKYLVFHAMAYEKLSKIDSALYYYNAAEKHNAAHDAYKNWIVFAQVGSMFQRAENYEKAVQYYKKAYALTKAKQAKSDHSILLYQFSNLYYQWGKVDECANMNSELQEFLRKDKNYKNLLPEHKMLFADWSDEPFNKKVKFMEEVKRKYLQGGFYKDAALANLHLSRFYEDKNDITKALSFVLENQRFPGAALDPIGSYNNKTIIYRLLKKGGNLKAAIAEADTLFKLRDEILALQQRESLLDIEAKYENQKKEQDIAFLSKENNWHLLNLDKERELKAVLEREGILKDSVVSRQGTMNNLLTTENNLKKTQLQNEKAIKNAMAREISLKTNQLGREKEVRTQVIGAASLLLLSGLIIFYLYQKQKGKNALILKQADDLQVLMKEIHHRVKNNLQIISSLLDLQSLSIKDKHAAGAVKEGRIRVQSMALIHQNLYSEGNIRGILMEGYIKNLVENLFSSYNIRDDKIKLVTDIDHLNLDVDTVIPLGLIMNELISNSLKYAFANTTHGEIFVTLKENEKQLQLLVRDTGCGFPADWNSRKDQSFGYSLINAFAQKLKAKMDVFNDGGACVSMHINRYKLAATI